MKKQSIMAILLLFFCMNISQGTYSAQTVDYEKYGNIAIAVVKADYPGQEVREYEYLGRKRLTQTDVTDSFRFQVMEKGKPVKVTVNITHSLKNKKLLSLSVREQR
jgi:hypothetical protein